jgi:hypothetical protein
LYRPVARVIYIYIYIYCSQQKRYFRACPSGLGGVGLDYWIKRMANNSRSIINMPSHNVAPERATCSSMWKILCVGFIKMDRQSSFMIHGRQLQCVLPPPLHPKRPFLFLFYKMKKKSSNPFYRLPLSTLNPSCPALTRKDFLPPQGLAINIKRSSSNTLTSDGYKSIMNTSLPAQP